MNEDNENNKLITEEQALKLLKKDLKEKKKRNSKLKEELFWTGDSMKTISIITAIVTIIVGLGGIYFSLDSARSEALKKAVEDGKFQQKVLTMIDTVKENKSDIKNGLNKQRTLITTISEIKTDKENIKKTVDELKKRIEAKKDK